ncbi:MAG: PD-(D/E)XK nuclease family protein [Anaerolineae bacterium]|nr:PD-(D/E)XK nuclease family protein [Anaerolineae bacterium]
MNHLPEDFIFSQSSLQDYVDCPRRFQLKYLLRQRYPAPEVDDLLEFERRMAQGERFHHLLHQHAVGLAAEVLQKRIDDDEVRRWFDTYMANGLNDVPERRYPEYSLTVPLGDYRLLAKFDLLALSEDKALIIDWKTSRHVPRRDRLQRRLQTIVYRYVLAKGGTALNGGQPIPPEQIEMRYWYADHEGQVVAFAYDAAQFEADEHYLTGLVREIEERERFPLTDDTTRCAYCTYRSLCERGITAGPLDEWELDEPTDLDELDFDFDQIAEIEF